MLNLIDQIIEIDKNARDQVAKAGEEAKQILDESKAKVQEMEREFDERINNRLSIVRDTYSRLAEDEISVLLKKQEERTNALKNEMKKNKSRFEREILERILGEYAEK